MTESKGTGTEPLSRWLELLRAGFDTQVRLGKEYADVARAALKRDVDQAAVSRTYLDSARREADQYWRSVASLWFNYASGVLAAGSRASRAVLHEVSSTVEHRRRPAGDEPGATATAHRRRLELVLTGPLGGSATGTVTIANNHPDGRRIALKPGTLLDSDGKPVDVPVTVKPRSMQLAPGAERVVTVTVELDAAALSAGSRYESVVELSGADEAELHVTVRPTG
jgi:hypothetical protein